MVTAGGGMAAVVEGTAARDVGSVITTAGSSFGLTSGSAVVGAVNHVTAGHAVFVGGAAGVLTTASSMIGRPSDSSTIVAIGTPASLLAAAASSSSTTLHAMTSSTSTVVPSGVITQNDLQKVMNSQELEKVMSPGELTLGHHLHHLHHNHHPLHGNLNQGNQTTLGGGTKLVDGGGGGGAGLPNHAAALSKLASGDLTSTMGKMNPNDLPIGSLCKMSPLELTYLG